MGPTMALADEEELQRAAARAVAIREIRHILQPFTRMQRRAIVADVVVDNFDARVAFVSLKEPTVALTEKAEPVIPEFLPLAKCSPTPPEGEE